jgi:hypothetical protein
MTQTVSWRHLVSACLPKLVFVITHPFCVTRADIVFNPGNVRGSWQGVHQLETPGRQDQDGE